MSRLKGMASPLPDHEYIRLMTDNFTSIYWKKRIYEVYPELIWALTPKEIAPLFELDIEEGIVLTDDYKFQWSLPNY